MQNTLDYIESEKERFLEELITFLKFKSISSLSEHKPDMEKCAGWLEKHLNEIGISDTRIIPTEGHSIVYGERLETGGNAPTVLIYGHYDVQPVDPLNLWKRDPFNPVVEDGKLWGRGTSDDKGQLFVHLKAIESILKKEGRLPVNIKLLIEGEEEAGSSHLDKFIAENREMLKCDTVLISDTEWFADGLPSICYALRGIAYFEIKVTGPNRDLHSGTFGGGVDNPLNVLCWMMGKLKDRYGRITIPGFYDDVLPLTEDERKEFLRLPFDEKEYCKSLGVDAVYGETGYSTLERVWARPSLDLNGIYGGFTGEGAKTVLPSHAAAKLSMRLVPNQDPAKTGRQLESYLRELTPPTIKLDFKEMHGGSPVLVPRDSKGVNACKTAFNEAFGKDPVFMREGGSIPIVEVFQRELKAPSVLMGLGLPGDNIHSPNENFAVENFFGGIKASAVFLHEFAK